MELKARGEKQQAKWTALQLQQAPGKEVLVVSAVLPAKAGIQ
jgi:hypothetical protein